jgi:hypothetical protein
MKNAVNRNEENQSVKRRFGSEVAVEELTGFSRRTLQKDRLLGRPRFPWYRVGGKVIYDLAEIEAIIRRNRRGGDAAEAG